MILRVFTLGLLFFIRTSLAEPLAFEIKPDTRLKSVYELKSSLGHGILVSQRKDSTRLVVVFKSSLQDVSNFLGRHNLKVPEAGFSVHFFEESVDHLPFPDWLKSSCHPGWMVPPNKIFIVTKRLKNCFGNQHFEESIKRVLIHELGHLILSRINQALGDNMEIHEGFATWFEYRVMNETLEYPISLCSNLSSLFNQTLGSYLTASALFSGLKPKHVFEKLSQGSLNYFFNNRQKFLKRLCPAKG
ncbi:MAG: hypothetical protein NZO16_06860 [Deltaproteobacteria bacterium]|nr:hypothetical protein [Deltaproteobacteria bacterium]